MKHGEIQALLESPELRRIFDEEPARIRTRTSRRKPATRSASSPEDGGGRRVGIRRSRKRRILVGLAPLYLAGLFLFFETVREPSMLLGVFGTPSVAEETPARAGAAVIVAAAPEKALEVELRRDAPAKAGGSAMAAATLDPARPAAAATKIAVADVRPGGETGKSVIVEKSVMIEKSATDVAKRAADRPGAESETAYLDLPAQDRLATPPVPRAKTASESVSAEGAAETPSLVLASNRPVADLPYPDQRPDAAAVPETIDAAAAAAEDALRLSRGDKREVQRRLRFASSDPRGIDGIFGPATRSAIAAWQEKAGLPATGFVDGPAMALLVEQTADEYRAWRTAERARAREPEARSAAVVASSAVSAPRASRDHDACGRIASGEIAFGRDVGCNFKAFGDNLKRDFKNLQGELRGLFD